MKSATMDALVRISVSKRTLYSVHIGFQCRRLIFVAFIMCFSRACVLLISHHDNSVCVCVSERLWSTGLQPLFLNLCLLPERRHCSKTVPGTVCTTSVFMKRVQIRSTMIFLTSSSSSGSIGCKCWR